MDNDAMGRSVSCSLENTLTVVPTNGVRHNIPSNGFKGFQKYDFCMRERGMRDRFLYYLFEGVLSLN
jgi:hypothetical protein